MLNKENIRMATPKMLTYIYQGLSESACRGYISKMEKDPDFMDSVKRPTGRKTLVYLSAFEEFLSKMEEKRFKDNV